MGFIRHTIHCMPDAKRLGTFLLHASCASGRCRSSACLATLCQKRWKHSSVKPSLLLLALQQQKCSFSAVCSLDCHCDLKSFDRARHHIDSGMSPSVWLHQWSYLSSLCLSHSPLTLSMFSAAHHNCPPCSLKILLLLSIDVDTENKLQVCLEPFPLVVCKDGTSAGWFLN